MRLEDESLLPPWQSKTLSEPINTPFHPIQKPSYYNTGQIEVIDFIEDHADRPGWYWHIIPYLTRAGNKPNVPALEDLKKAKWWLERWIAFEENKLPKE